MKAPHLTNSRYIAGLQCLRRLWRSVRLFAPRSRFFQDEGTSGAKGRQQRPEFDQLLRGVTRREFDLIAAWSVCRLGRSLQDLVGFLQEIEGRGVGLYLHQQALDTSTPAGRAMFGMLSVFSDFERAMIRSRVVAGLP